MKKLIATFLLLAVSSSLALAQGDPTIGIYDDPDYTVCFGDLELFLSKTLHNAVFLPPEIETMTACEFSIPDVPANGPLGIRTDTWTTPLVIGDLDWGIALAWSSPQPGPWVLAGTMDFFMIDATWVPQPGYVMTVMESNDSGVLVVVDGNYETIPADGGQYTFGCPDQDCVCFIVTPTEDASWGSLKALY